MANKKTRAVDNVAGIRSVTGFLKRAASQVEQSSANAQRQMADLSLQARQALSKGLNEGQRVVKAATAQVQTKAQAPVDKLTQAAAQSMSQLSNASSRAYAQGKRWSAQLSSQAADKLAQGADSVSQVSSSARQQLSSRFTYFSSQVAGKAQQVFNAGKQTLKSPSTAIKTNSHQASTRHQASASKQNQAGTHYQSGAQYNQSASGTKYQAHGQSQAYAQTRHQAHEQKRSQFGSKGQNQAGTRHQRQSGVQNQKLAQSQARSLNQGQSWSQSQERAHNQNLAQNQARAQSRGQNLAQSQVGGQPCGQARAYVQNGAGVSVSKWAGFGLWRMLGVLTLCGCGVLSVGLLSGCEKEAQTSYTPSLAEAVYEVATIHPQFKNRERSFMLNGRISAYTRADVRPQVDGIILQRLFTEGTQVEEGTPLYEIDPAPFKAALEHAQASYERAIVQRKMAAKDYERFELLYRKRSASEKERDDALLAYELAQADEKLYKSALDTAQISLNYTKVSAPISGIIGVSKVTRGALVNANQSEPLATIIDLDKVYVDLEQSALEWRKLREGLLTGNIYLNDQAYDVSLYFQDSALYPHLGNLSLSEVLVDEVSGAVALRAVFDNPEHLLLPGMAVMCKLNGGIAQNIMTLPAQAVLRDPKGNAYVYTVQGERAVQTPVKLGDLYNDGWQIVDGLDSTYEVIISGAAALTHGSKVKVVNQDGVDLTTTVQSEQVKDPDAAVQAVTKPNISSSGLGNSSVNVP